MICRDKYGVAYINADSDRDAWFGLGFCHGQDRAFQLESLMRTVRGTMSEVVGAAGLAVDRLSRRIGFYRAAYEQIAVLDEDIKVMLEAYANGVNHGLKDGGGRNAHEFSLIRSEPSTYTAADALALLKFLSFGLASNWDVELARLMILRQDGREAVEALDPSYPSWLRVTSPPASLAGDAQSKLMADLSILMDTNKWKGIGSNCWAVSPSRTSTGRPILANDPHLAPVLPSYWYLAHVRTPDWAVAGASFVGAPSFPTGHNGFVAWGLTAGMLDNTDLFVEEMAPDGKSVREGDSFVPCDVRTEIINVRDAPPLEEEVLITRRGPIIGPAMEGDLGAISIQATWLQPRPARGLFGIHQARSVDEMRKCFELWPLLPLNILYADVDGNIAWQLGGDAPSRRKGWGTVPLLGYDTEAGWRESPVDFWEMPFDENPEAGYLASANNQPTPDIDNPFLGVDWTDGYRATRIAEILEARKDWDVSSTQVAQVDQLSIPWRELREIVLAAANKNPAAERAFDILGRWDGRISIDSVAASIFEFFLVEMTQRVTRAKAPNSSEFALGKGLTPLAPNSMFIGRRIGHLVRLVRDQPDNWFDRSWSEEIADALAASTTALQIRFGPDANNWAWGRIRTLTLEHAEGNRSWPDNVFNLGPIPWGGDINTVCQAEYTADDPAGNPTSFASLRAVYDVGRWEDCRFALPGGQSGNPLSRNYMDQLSIWQRSEGIPIAWDTEHVGLRVIATLTLEPTNGQSR